MLVPKAFKSDAAAGLNRDATLALGGMCYNMKDGEHQLLLAHGAGIFDPIFFRERDELGRRFRFEVLE